MVRKVIVFLIVAMLSASMQAQDSVYARRIVAKLSSVSMKGRGYNGHGDRKAARFLRSELRRIGAKPLSPHYFQRYNVERSMVRNVYFPYSNTYHTQNVCAVVEGETDSVMIFCAHYDHLGIDAQGRLYPGAHDNASGVAAVLDLARQAAQHRPHYTHVFLFFSGEEAGLLGSSYAASHPLWDYSKVRLLVNIDMFCGGDEGFMVVNGKDSPMSSFVDRLESYNNIHHLAADIRRRPNAANSDHFYFSSHCPAIFIYTLGGLHGDYHQPSDTCEACALGHYEDFLNLIRLLSE